MTGDNEQAQPPGRLGLLIGLGALVIIGLVGAGIFFIIRAASGIAAKNDEDFALLALRGIVTANARFVDEDQDRDGASDYARSLRELGDPGSLPASLAAGSTGPYALRYRPRLGEMALEAEPDVEPHAYGYEAWASPGEQASSARHFYVDDSGLIRVQEGSAAGPDSPVWEEE